MPTPTIDSRHLPFTSQSHTQPPRIRGALPCLPLAPLCLLALLALPSTARADWLLSMYIGGVETASNTLEITPAAGSTVSIPNVAYEGRAFSSPPYYGYRVGWTPTGGHLGIEYEFTHAKAIATGTPSPELTDFQLSHGLNFILGNVVYRSSPYCSGRCTLVARGGAGITYPHVEATFRGRTTYDYEFAGFGAQGGVGVEIKAVSHFYVVGDARLTYARIRTDLVDGGRLAAPFTTGHLDVGVAWHSAR